MKDVSEHGFAMLFLSTCGIEFFKLVYDYLIDPKIAFAIVCVMFTYAIMSSKDGSAK